MSILQLPFELLMLIAHQLDCSDLNAFLQIHSSIYESLNDYLYHCNVQNGGSSALFWAAKHGSQKTLQRLLDAGADIRWKSDYWARSRPWGRCAPYRKLYLRRPASGLQEHPISYAASGGHIEVVRLLLQGGADINFKDATGRSPLALAARNGHLGLVKMLISLGACQLSLNRSGQRSIADAASQGHTDIEDYLLEELKKYPYFCPKLTIQSEIQWMLSHAARRGDQSRVKYLVSIGADVNFQRELYSSIRCSGFCPIPLGVVKLLLELGANPDTRRSPSLWKYHGQASILTLPLHEAMKRDESYLLTKLLLQFGASAEAASRALFTAVNLEKPAEFRLLVEHGADIHIRDRKKYLFKHALESPCEGIRNVILERGITPETPDQAAPKLRNEYIDN